MCLDKFIYIYIY